RGSFETLAITIGQSGILETVTGLVVGLAGIIDKLSEADPALLNFAVTVGVVMAAIGPFLIAIGSIMSAVGGLIPIFIKLAPVIGAIVPVLATLGRALLGLAIAGGPLTLVALAVSAVYLAWQNWDKIVAIVRTVYTAAKTWLVDKMNVVFEAVRAKVKSVGDAFYELWDRVVGHSYVPDLVDGVSAEFNRLRDVMTRPAEAETERTGQAFLGLAQNVEGSMNSIIRSVKSGDVSGILGGLSGLLGAGKSIFSIFKGSPVTPTGGGTTTGGGSLGLPPIEMFKTGGSFEVGGSGGVDSQLMQFYATPGEMVRITKGDEASARGGVVIHQTFAPNLAGSAVDRAELGRFAVMVKQDTIATIRDLKARGKA
ncbi:hypothetical protein, partial [Sphingomonas montanisoli]|uniref:hypothetical protein n=1 Tax=Sphingomonas montanisoli TaxID=2606412 RepID=UPI0015E193F3